MSPVKKHLHRSYKLLLSLAITTFLADVIAKYFAIQGAFHGQEKAIVGLGFFANTGVAFSLPVPLPFALAFTSIVTVGLAYSAYKQRITRPMASIYAMIAILGALNNGLDRALHQWTTDYIFIFQRLAINLSDVLVIIGILGYIWYSDAGERLPKSSG